MNPLEHAAATLRAVEERLHGFLRTTFERAGLGAVDVNAAPGQGGFVLLPYRVYPWPRVAETPTPVPLLGPARSERPGAPELWVQLGQLATPAVERAFLRPDRNRVERLMPTAPLSSLPAPLAEWYTRQGERDASWAPVDGNVRLPLLEWRPDFIIRLGLLGFASPGQPDALTLPAVATLAIHQARTLDVRVPPRPAEPGLFELVDALATMVEPDAGARLRELTRTLAGPMDTRIALLLQSEAADTDLDPMLRAIGAAAAPTVHLTVQLGVGGGPALGGASTPVANVAKEAR